MHGPGVWTREDWLGTWTALGGSSVADVAAVVSASGWSGEVRSNQGDSEMDAS
jgi:hypothetical protein